MNDRKSHRDADRHDSVRSHGPTNIFEKETLSRGKTYIGCIVFYHGGPVGDYSYRYWCGVMPIYKVSSYHAVSMRTINTVWASHSINDAKQKHLKSFHSIHDILTVATSIEQVVIDDVIDRHLYITPAPSLASMTRLQGGAWSIENIITANTHGTFYIDDVLSLYHHDPRYIIPYRGNIPLRILAKYQATYNGIGVNTEAEYMQLMMEM